MSTAPTAGARLRAAVDAGRPLQVVGTIDACPALLAARAGLYELLGYHEYERRIDALIGREKGYE